MRWLFVTMLVACQGENVQSTSEPTILLGNDVRQPQVQEAGIVAGTAIGYETAANLTGRAHNITFFVDTTNACSRIVAGVYDDRETHPNQRLARAVIPAPKPGWNTVPLDTEVTTSRNTHYWLALLCPKSAGGVLRYPDNGIGPYGTELELNKALEDLPMAWTTGATNRPDGPVSAYLTP